MSGCFHGDGEDEGQRAAPGEPRKPFTGGAAGIAVGVLAAWLMANLAGWSTIVSAFSIVLAAAFSVAVGVFFGLLPARQAARLNPIEALRYE